jgi:hypothetical protein
MTITALPTLAATEYETRLKAFLSRVEKNAPNPYMIDGHPTIGIGFDLTFSSPRAEVFKAMGITDATVITKLTTAISGSYTSDTALQNAMNTAYGKSFVMTTTQIDLAFKAIATPHTNDVQTKTGLAFSDELVAVTSAHFNGVFGSGLKTALNITDPYEARAEAWYQIRYAHLADQNESRRYSEASVFGLYNEKTGVVSKNEALGTYKMYTHYYSESYDNNGGMITYDNDNNAAGGPIALSNGDLAKMAAQNSVFTGYSTHVIGEELVRAATALETAYLKPLGLTLSSAAINPLNIQVSMIATTTSYVLTTAQNHIHLTGENTTTHTGYINDLLIGDDAHANELTGNAGRDILLGLGGKDTLYGGANNDILNGGAGDDILVGGAGNDTLTGGLGIDNLTGGTNNDTYVVDGSLDKVNELAGEGIDTVKVANNFVTTVNFQNIEKLVINPAVTVPVTVELNQLTSLTLSKNADNITLHLNQAQTAQIVIATGAGADTVHLKPGLIDTNNPLLNVVYRDYLKFTDLTVNDKIDLTDFHIVKMTESVAGLIGQPAGYYLIHNAVTTDWRITWSAGDDVNIATKIDLIGNIPQENFII